MLECAVIGIGQIIPNSANRIAAVNLQHGPHRALFTRHHDAFATVEQNFSVQHNVSALWLNGTRY